MKVTISSDDFVQIKPSKFYELKDIAETPNRFAFYNFGVYKPHGLGVELSKSQKPQTVTVRALCFLNFTNAEVFAMLSKALRIVENTPEYTEYQLNKTFSTQEAKFSLSTPPGTVRIFSNDLICFYNGKSWRKLHRAQ
jgi:hypothetical protein